MGEKGPQPLEPGSRSCYAPPLDLRALTPLGRARATDAAMIAAGHPVGRG